MTTLIAILGFINIFLILYRLDIGLYFFTVLLPFTSLLPATGIPGLNVASIIIVLLLVKSYSSKADIVCLDRHIIPNLNNAIILLFIWCLITIFFSKLLYSYQTLPLMDYLEKLYRWFIYIFLYFVYKRELSSKTKVYYALLAISVGVFAEAVFVTKALILSDRVRTYGTIGQSNELALFFSCYILIPFLFLLHDRRLKYKLFFLSVIALSLLGISSTLSRGGLLVIFFVTIGYILLRFKKKGLIVIFIGVLFSGTLYTFLPEKIADRIDETFVDETERGHEIGNIRVDRSAYSRIPLAKAGLIMFSESPIWGKGFMAYPLLVTNYEYGGQYGIDRMKASHNMHVRMLAELGLVGYFLFLTFFSNSIRAGLHLYRNAALDKRDKDLGIILCLISVGFLIGCLFGDRFFRGTLISYFFIISAACYNISLFNKTESPPVL